MFWDGKEGSLKKGTNGIYCNRVDQNFSSIFNDLEDAYLLSILFPSGGLELLCDSVKIHHVNVEPQAGESKVNFILDDRCYSKTYYTESFLQQ